MWGHLRDETEWSRHSSWHLKESWRCWVGWHGSAEVTIDIGIQQITVDTLGEGGSAFSHLLCVHDLFGLGLLALDSLLVDLVVVDLADLVDNILMLECDKAEATVTFGGLVEHKHGVVDFAVLVEVGLDILA